MAITNPTGEVDPNVAVPAAVRAAAERAAQLHTQAYGEPPKPDAAPAAPGGEDKPITIVDTTPAPLPRVSTPAGDKVILPKSAPPPPPPQAPVQTQGPPPAAPAAPAELPAAPNADKPTLHLTPRGSAPPPAPSTRAREYTADQILELERQAHEARSMRGRYEQTQRTLSTMQEQLSETTNELARLQRATMSPLNTVVPPEQSAITEEERKQYGDSINVMQKAAKDVLTPVVQELAKQNDVLAQEILKERERSKLQAIHSQLDGAVPNWREINRSQEFADWLSLPDFYSGERKGVLLKRAFEAGNAALVVRFFQGFVVDATSRMQPQRQQQAPALNLASLAAPGAPMPASGTDPSQIQQPDRAVYSHQFIRNFYAEVRRGLWAHREAERQALEADIIAAGAQGRVR